MLRQLLLTRYPTRLRTRMAWVQNSEKSLEEKRQHCKPPLSPSSFPFIILISCIPSHFFLQYSSFCNLLNPFYLPPSPRKPSTSRNSPAYLSLSLSPPQPQPHHPYSTVTHHPKPQLRQEANIHPPANNHRHQSRPSL